MKSRRTGPDLRQVDNPHTGQGKVVTGGGRDVRPVVVLRHCELLVVKWFFAGTARPVSGRSRAGFTVMVRRHQPPKDNPPLTLTVCPLICPASSEIRNATTSATSSTVGGRPCGNRSAAFANNFC